MGFKVLQKGAIQQLRLISGLVLLIYVTTHFLNHALGLRSLEAMEKGQLLFIDFWRSYPGTLVLYLALAVHISLALVALYHRDRFSALKGWEIVQLTIGLLIPLVLIQHVLGTRIAHELYNVNDRYTYSVLVMWKYLPYLAWLQPLTLILVWLHGCMGVHFWLRLKPGYQSWKALLLACAVLVPTLGLLGFVDAGLTVLELAKNPEWEAAIRFSANAPPDSVAKQISEMTFQARGAYLGILLLVVSLRAVRLYGASSRRGVSIEYDNGRKARVSKGTSILDASRSIGLPHASVCGGRGRCSTCRVRIMSGNRNSPPPDNHELKVLARVGAPANVRLACQFRPLQSIKIARLLPPMKASLKDALARPGYVHGEEKEIAVLFADLRGFTRLSEQKLPYDTVFILNRYFSEMGRAVELAGGRLDKFVGDGVVALFGIERGPGPGVKNALVAAKAMAENLEELNAGLAGELEQPLRIGIGIHVGPAIVGEMGYGSATALTAIGDTVNIASRLEAATKKLGVPMVVSESVYKHARRQLADTSSRTISLSGRDQPVVVHLVHEPDKLDIRG